MLQILLIGLPTGILMGGFIGILIAGIFEMKSVKAHCVIGLCIILFTLICGFGFHANATQWNGGYCPKCHYKYELCGATTFNKYYQCSNPNCTMECTR